MVGAMPVNLIPKFCNGTMESRNGTDDNEIQVHIGSRIKCGEDFATVKYIGEVQGYKGVWYGVEWDEPGRGKHDGSVDDVQYFKTSKPLAGSFIRPNKISPMKTCEEAIRRYYGDREKVQSVVELKDVYWMIREDPPPSAFFQLSSVDETVAAHRRTIINEWKREMGAPFIEMVGFEKIHQKQTFDRLLEVCVHDQQVAKAGDVASLCPNVRSLDVSRNLFSNWREVIQLSAQLPDLTELNISKNRMSIDMSEETLSQLSNNIAALQKINISHCDYEWSDILALSHLWPSISEVIAAYNRIRKMSMPFKTFTTLTVLRLDGNPIDSWHEVMNVGGLKNLKVLSLNDCQIQHIEFNDECDKVDLFESLEVLFLNRNKINDWRSISELDKLICLKKLYFLKNPVQTSEDYDTCSQLIIAKIGTLQEVNGSSVTRELRRGAEYDYLKRHGAEWKAAQGDAALKRAFDIQHCRFNELITKYGIPDDSLLVKQPTTTTLISQLLEVTIYDENGKSIKKKFPSTMSVQKLVTLAQRMFSKSGYHGVPTLYLIDEQMKSEIPLDNNMKDLAFFSVKNNDKIVARFR